MSWLFQGFFLVRSGRCVGAGFALLMRTAMNVRVSGTGNTVNITFNVTAVPPRQRRRRRSRCGPLPQVERLIAIARPFAASVKGVVTVVLPYLPGLWNLLSR